MAIIRPGAALIETAGGLSDQYHEWIRVTGYPGLLTITKECKERKYRGMTACLFAPLARVHAASGPGCQTVQYCLALRLSNGVGSAEKINDPVFHRFCRSLQTFTRLCEEVTQHCNTFINAQLFKAFSEPAGSMPDFCHTRVRQLADFTAPECEARLKFSKKEMTIIKIVVGWFERMGGAAINDILGLVFL